MTNSAELRVRLETGITQLESDLDRLRAALAALDGNDTPAPRAPRQRVAARRRRRGTGPAAAYEVVPEGKLTRLLGDGKGLSTAELAQQCSGSPDQVLRMLKELERSGRAHRTGNRRSTRWHAGRVAGRSR
jgi:hypothetical protein